VILFRKDSGFPLILAQNHLVAEHFQKNGGISSGPLAITTATLHKMAIVAPLPLAVAAVP
jgi:hypothetical protein